MTNSSLLLLKLLLLLLPLPVLVLLLLVMLLLPMMVARLQSPTQSASLVPLAMLLCILQTLNSSIKFEQVVLLCILQTCHNKCAKPFPATVCPSLV